MSKVCVYDLRQQARSLKIKNYSRLRKDLLQRYVEDYPKAKKRLCDDTDPITMEPLVWPWFELFSDLAKEHAHGFDPVALAEYYKSTDRFINPRTLQKVSRADMLRLDTLLVEMNMSRLANNVSLFDTIDKRRKEREVFANTTILFERELDRILENMIECSEFPLFHFGCGMVAAQFLPCYADYFADFLRHDFAGATAHLRCSGDYVQCQLRNTVKHHTMMHEAAPLEDISLDDASVMIANENGEDVGLSVSGNLQEASFRRIIFLLASLHTVRLLTTVVDALRDDFDVSDTIGTNWIESVVRILECARVPRRFPRALMLRSLCQVFHRKMIRGDSEDDEDYDPEIDED
jgi:hypothetical protein